ncbi:MAG: hexameric tyrosine-coordinated heme protein [Gracilimonas sp.]|uniref:hexameric tyrosine-coordinated heme protein n=1 Tax=Gracilimonas sp. TaxID=1974203 RepID=UPI00375017DA|nr:hexameric tyrosine-coordinated heme protein [Gracilimonas sp.]
MIKYISAIGLLFLVFAAGTAFVAASQNKEQESAQNNGLTLITETPEEGFAVAVQLARKGVTTTQPDKDVLFTLRDVYSKDPDALIASSQVIAIHYQTVAAANNYWRN